MVKNIFGRLSIKKIDKKEMKSRMPTLTRHACGLAGIAFPDARTIARQHRSAARD